MLFPFGIKLGIFQIFVIIGFFIIKISADEHPEKGLGGKFRNAGCAAKRTH